MEDFSFDTGATFFLYPRIIEEIFAKCGFDFQREVPMTRVDPPYQIAFMRPGGGSDRLHLWADRKQLDAEVARFSPKDTNAFSRFSRDNRAKLKAFDNLLSQPFGGLHAFLQPKVLAALRYLRSWQSLDAYLKRYFIDPRLRLAFSFQSKYLGMSPYQCPCLFSILAFLEHEHGVWHPTGGSNAVMQAMARLATHLGVTIKRSSTSSINAASRHLIPPVTWRHRSH